MWWYIGGAGASLILCIITWIVEYNIEKELEIKPVDIYALVIAMLLSWIGSVVVLGALISSWADSKDGVLLKFVKKDKKNDNESGTLD